MSGVAPRQYYNGVPSANTPFINVDGTLVPTWYQFLIGLWQRSGAALPTPADSVFLVQDSGQILAFNAATGELLQSIGGVSEILTGDGLGGGPITTFGTIYILPTGVTAGNYHLADFEVNERGQLISATDGVVALADITPIADQTILGNDSGGAAAPSEIAIGPGLTMAGQVLSATSATVLAGLVATGTTQAAGYVLGHGVYIFGTVTVTDYAATLPGTGGMVTVLNRSAGGTALQVFPPVGGTIETLAIDTSAPVSSPLGSQRYYSEDGIAWFAA